MALALPLVSILTHCANLTCPPEQQLDADSCVCSSTLEPPVDGMCLRDACTPEGCSCTVEGIESAIARGGMQALRCGPNAAPVSSTETIVIDNDVILDGQGNLTIEGDGNHLILDVQAGTVTLMGITVTNGDQGIRVAVGASVALTNCGVNGNTSRSSAGGGIFNEGKLTLIDTAVENNIADVGSGGGVYNDSTGMLALEDSSRVSDNEARSGPGGGIRNDRGAVEINASEVSRNTAFTTGGGIANTNGTVTITDSFILDNEASAHGGGVANEGADAEVYVRVSTVSGNKSTDPGTNGHGGGLWDKDGRVEAERSTWSENTAGRTGGGFFIEGEGATVILKSSTLAGNSVLGNGSIGGGLRLFDRASATIINSTLYDNASGGGGGDGIHIGDNCSVEVSSSTISSNGKYGISNFGSLTLIQTIIEGACVIRAFSSSVESDDHNIESPGDTCGLDGDTDSVNVTSVELSLAEQLEDNGGDTFTLIPGRSSVAVGNFPGGCNQPEDQRGVSRPQGSRCDIGAVELED